MPAASHKFMRQVKLPLCDAAGVERTLLWGCYKYVMPLASGICAFADSINMSSLCDDERWIIKDLIS